MNPFRLVQDKIEMSASIREKLRFLPSNTTSGLQSSLIAASFLVLGLTSGMAPATAQPDTVYFDSLDQTTKIVGYLFRPAGSGPHPAIVLLHGRGGPYSSNDNADCTVVAEGVSSPCNAGTLSKRHVMWGQYWADHGVLALLPDSFGPRGKAHGFPRFSHGDSDRDDVNELTVRPLDAEGALDYLQSRGDVRRSHLPAGLVERRFDHAERDDPPGTARGDS